MVETFGNEFTTIFYVMDPCATGMLGVSGEGGVQGADGAVEYDITGHNLCSSMGTPSAIAT